MSPLGPSEIGEAFAIIVAGVIAAAVVADAARGDVVPVDPQRPWAECYEPDWLNELTRTPGLGYPHAKPTPVETPRGAGNVPVWVDGGAWAEFPASYPPVPSQARNPGGGSVETPGNQHIPPVPLPAIGASLLPAAIGALVGGWIVWRRR